MLIPPNPSPPPNNPLGLTVAVPFPRGWGAAPVASGQVTQGVSSLHVKAPLPLAPTMLQGCAVKCTGQRPRRSRTREEALPALELSPSPTGAS